MTESGCTGPWETSRRLDPRVRLFIGLLAVTAVLITRTRPALMAQSGLLALGLFTLARETLRLSWVHLVWPMVAMVFVISVLAFDLETAADVSLRLINLFAASAVFFQTLKAEELALALRSFKVPATLVFILLTAMRYVPLLGRALHHIHDAQTARGIDVRLRLSNVARLFALVMPLLVQAFVLAENLALAMESRGFSRQTKAERRLGPLDRRDIFWGVLALVVFLVLFLWERPIR